MSMKKLIYFLLLPMLLKVSACAADEPKTLIQSGERVYLNYTCTTAEGLAISTDLDEVERFGDHKTSYFLPTPEPGPVLVTTGKEKIAFWNTVQTSVNFTEGVRASLADGIVGRPYDQPFKIHIKGWALKNITERERYLSLNRESSFLCHFTTTHEGTKESIGENYKPGDHFPVQETPGMEYVIEKVTEDEVTVNTLFEDGLTLDHPHFGKVRFFHVDDKNCVQKYEPKVGMFIRSGPLVGRVIKVDEKSFITDFGDPLAGQTLSCDVRVTRTNDANVAAK